MVVHTFIVRMWGEFSGKYSTLLDTRRRGKASFGNLRFVSMFLKLLKILYFLS